MKPDCCWRSTLTSTPSAIRRLAISSPCGRTVLYCLPSLPVHPLDEFGIADLAAVHLGRSVAEQIEQRQDHQKQHDPEGDIARIAQRHVLRG
jgi:hypothetical protein